MSNIEKACLLSCENWVDSFPAEIPKHKFSKKHTETIKEILHHKEEKKIHKFSKKTIKILLIAAILLSVATTVFAIPASREFIVEKFFNHSEYNMVDTSDVKKVTSLKLNYIPKGFEKTEDYGDICLYEKGDKSFSVQKSELTATIKFDTEKHGSETLTINGREAVYSKSDNNEQGLIFNNGEYIYVISGNIDKEELVNIAQNVEWLFVKEAEFLASFIFLSQNEKI